MYKRQAHDLPEGHEVRYDPVDPEPTGPAGAEPGHDLVGDEEGAVLPAGVLEALVEPGDGRHDTHVSGRGLGDDAGDLTGVPVEGLVDRFEVVVRQHDRVAGLGAGDAGGVGQREGGDTGTGGGEQRVDVTVVTPGELDDLGPAREPAGQPDGGHRGLGPAAHEPHLLHGLDAGDDLLGERDLALTGGAEGGAARDGVVDGGDHVGLRVPEDHRAPGADEVDVLAPVRVRQIGAGAGHHEAGRAADGAEGAHRGVHAARGDDRRAVEETLRDGCVVGIRQGVRRPARPSAGRFAGRSAGRFGHDLRLLRLLGLLGLLGVR